jgi:hypothetical protein
MRKLLETSICAMLALGAANAEATTTVPPGNRSVEQPGVPGASAKRTKQGKTSFDAKYRKVYNLLKNDKKLRSKIREAAAAYGIDPMHIVGAIVGEHTYNVDAYDRLQTYYVKAVSYLGNSFSFSMTARTFRSSLRAQSFPPALACPAATISGLAGKTYGTARSAGRSSAAGSFRTTASARPSSSPSMPDRLSGSASLTR